MINYARHDEEFHGIFKLLNGEEILAKAVITEEDWHILRDHIQYNFLQDGHFAELKEAEIWRERFDMLATVDEYVGKYVSYEWVRKHVLKQTDEDIKELKAQIADEVKSGEIDVDDEDF